MPTPACAQDPRHGMSVCILPGQRYVCAACANAYYRDHDQKRRRSVGVAAPERVKP